MGKTYLGIGAQSALNQKIVAIQKTQLLLAELKAINLRLNSKIDYQLRKMLISEKIEICQLLGI